MDFEQWKSWREEQIGSQSFYERIKYTSNLGLLLFALNVALVGVAALFFYIM